MSEDFIEYDDHLARKNFELRLAQARAEGRREGIESEARAIVAVIWKAPTILSPESPSDFVVGYKSACDDLGKWIDTRITALATAAGKEKP